MTDEIAENWSWVEGVESRARSYARRFPVEFSHGQGSELITADGRRFIDLLAGAGVQALGHAHPRILAAIADEQAPIISSLDLTTSAKVRFLQTFLGVLPKSLEGDAKVHFCGPTGSDGVEAACKLARRVTGRRGLFTFYGSYHGMSQGALSLTASRDARRAGLDARMDVTFCPFPYPFRGKGAWSDPEAAIDLALAHVETLLEDDHSGTDIPAAMIIEAVQGEGGSIVAPPRFLRGLRALCDRFGILLILDEIQAGMGRSGRWWALEHADINPDMMVVSKAVGGGIPMALLVYRKEYDVWEPGDHIGTFRGQHLAFVAGRAVLEEMQESNLVDRVAQMGSRLTQRLQSLVDRYDMAGEARGVGLLQGLELVGRPGLTASEASRTVQARLFERGVVIERGGRDGATLRFLPPLTIPETTLDQAVDLLEQELARL
ncbi:aspartate aminotransferase family protein [Lacibacterium aquatile]|uniref:Aspartate aminotransferase family protein n=1 Tax=Lacibacterium aquatile TaxID=1168082 RepID=A0ABW5DW95_9PROT